MGAQSCALFFKMGRKILVIIKAGRWIRNVFIGLMLFVVVQIPTLADGYWGWWGETQSNITVWKHWVSFLALSVAVWIILFMTYRKVTSSYKLFYELKSSMIVQAIVVAVAVVSFEMLISLIFSTSAESENYEIIHLIHSPLGMLTLICSNVVSPILEELLFRGIIQGVLREALPGVLAIMLTNLLFAFGHGYQIESALGMFVVGCGFSWLLIKTKNLSMPMLSHMTVNWLVTIINLMFI